MRKLGRLFFPSGIFTLAIAGLLFADATRTVLYRFSNTIFIVVLALGLLLTLRFGRSKHFFVLLMLAGMSAAAPFVIPVSFSSMTAQQTFYYHSAAMLVPLHCALFAWWRERGLLNIWGTTRLLWIFLVPVAAAVAGMFPEVINNPYMVRFFFNSPIPRHPGLLLVPMAVTALSLVLLLAMYLRDPSPARDGFFWTVVIIAAGFFTQNGIIFFQLTASGAIVVLLISMIETGHFFAYRDELTGLPSRRAMNEKLQSLGRTYTIAMVDVDHFKRFNDRYGHDVGDEVLKMVAGVLKEAKGNAYRFGGEEFAIIFPGKKLVQIKAEAEHIRHSVYQSAFVIRNPHRKRGKTAVATTIKPGTRKRVSVTVSIGLAQRSQRHTSPEAVIKAADKALYKAKKNGRNRTETIG